MERDELFEDAARLVVRHNCGSISLSQRHLKLGYQKAGRIMNELEKAKIVGKHNDAKPRDALFKTTDDLENHLKSL